MLNNWPDVIAACCVCICAAFAFWARLHHDYKMKMIELDEQEFRLKERMIKENPDA